MTGFYRIVFVYIILLASLGKTFSQVRGLDLLDEKGEAEVSFEIEQGFIIVKMWLNGIIPLRMIFDTGAENTILFDKEITQILGIEFERQIPIIGSDLDSVLIANIARNVRARLDGCSSVFRDLIVLEDNSLLLNEKLGTEINGILGGSFFSNLVVRIDYRKNKIYLNHPQYFKPPSSFESYNLEIVSNKPYIQGDVNISGEKTNRLSLLLDTGAALPFLIHTNTDSTLQIPERVMVGNVGYGLSGVIYGYRGKSKKLSLGELYFNEIVTSFQDLVLSDLDRDIQLIRNGIIGNTLLSRFKVIIDYTREKLYLKPIKKKYNKDFGFDKSGITLFAVGPKLKQYYVVAVIKGSPADRAGVMPGDIITKVGKRKAHRMELQDITDKFTKKAGKTIKLTLLRGLDELKVQFVLEEWFNEQEEK